MSPHAIERATRRDHGVSADAVGARIWARRTSPPLPITSAAAYVGVVRRLAWGRTDLPPLEGESRVDGRLLAVGWNCVSPTRFLDLLPAWIAYWERAADRPKVVGSCYNGSSPEEAFQCFLGHVPAWVATRVGALALRLSPARARWAAAAAHDVRPARHGVSTRLLCALGRLCPELRRVALESIPEQLPLRPDSTYQQRRARMGDVDWERVAQVQRALLGPGGDRLRVALAYRELSHSRAPRRFWWLTERAMMEVSNGTDETWINAAAE